MHGLVVFRFAVLRLHLFFPTHDSPVTRPTRTNVPSPNTKDVLCTAAKLHERKVRCDMKSKLAANNRFCIPWDVSLYEQSLLGIRIGGTRIPMKDC